MRYVSTTGRAPAVSLADAVVRGLAPDGGLYLPERIDLLPPQAFRGLRRSGASMAETADVVLEAFLAEIDPTERRRLLQDALDFPVPLVELEAGIRVLELFHGPTLAFKDVGARVLARLLAWALRHDPRAATVLVATSGDTGSAVADAFHGVAGVRVAVLYPRGRVSPLQERQLTTVGGNVRALAVEGSFDDCQRLVKAAFADPGLSREMRLTSANSINVGRLLPQLVYYVHAWAQLLDDAPPVLFATPSGNFGNLTAGLLAHRLGLPVAGFVAATNVNDVVPEFLETGEYRPRASRRTISNAMDVGDPSNFARLLHLEGGGKALCRRLVGSRHTDDETRDAITDVHRRTGYVLDPHGAVGYLGLRRALDDCEEPRTGIVLATAHPIKFREHVEPLLGRQLEIPARLRETLTRETSALPLPPEPEALRRFLLDWTFD